MQKKAARKAAKAPILPLSQTEEKELIIDSETFEKLERFLAKSGGEKAGLSLSDVVAHLLLEKGPNGFKFSAEKKEPKSVNLKLPKAAWDIAEKSAKKSGAPGISEVVKELTTKL
jgi:hypothetical protein